MKRLTLIIAAGMIGFVGNAQMDIDKSIKMDFKLPIPLANKSFVRVVNGISDINLSFQFPVWRNITLGVGAKHTLYQINEFNLPETTEGNVQFTSGFLKLGYEKFLTTNVYVEGSVKGGYTYMDFKSKTCFLETGNWHQTDKSILLEPNVGLYMISRDNLAFGLIVSYTMIMDNFRPERLCLDRFTGHSEAFSQGIYGTFNVGFGFSVFLNKKSGFRN